MDSGTWLSTVDSIVFVAGAARDGFAESDVGNLKKAGAIKETIAFTKAWEKYLSAMLLNPPLHLRLPPKLVPHVLMPELIDSGLVTLSPAIPNGSKVARLARIYERAYGIYRKLEGGDYGFRAMLSYDALLAGGRRTQGSEVLLAELENAETALASSSVHLSRELGALFEAHVAANMSVIVPSLRQMNQEFAMEWAPRNSESSPFQAHSPLFEAMGLRFLRPEEFGGNRPPFDFEPQHMLQFAEFDELLTNAPSDMEGAIKRMVGLSTLGDLNRFIEVFSYWKTIFEVTDLIDLARKGGGSLFYAREIRPSVSQPAVPSKALEENYLFQIFLSSRNCVPVMNGIPDVLRLREDKALSPLKEKIAQWNMFPKDGIIDIPNFVKKEIDAAAKQAGRTKGISKFGKLIGMVALPLKWFSPTKATVAGIAGKLASLVAWKRDSSIKWLSFGTTP